MTPTEMHIDALMEKIEKLQAENARYRAALEYFMGCVMTVDEATIPKLGIESNPKQVVFNLSCSYVRILKTREALEWTKE